MQRLILFNKPFHVMSQFTDSGERATLADFIPLPDVYPAGRLDYDSEGLLLLTNAGWLQHRIADPKHHLQKTYLVQVEGVPTTDSLRRLSQGVLLKDGKTKPAVVQSIDPPDIWDRTPPIRFRKNIPTCWLKIAITEGRNRQVRRMTAAVGYPTLRLVRVKIGPWELADLLPGKWREIECPKQ
jgi:23S rRNA pseudouridine2457 synthase